MQPTDRELLEAAALAAGHTVFNWGRAPEWHQLRYKDCLLIGPRKSFMEDPDQMPWNPLADDGDALRLAVKLDMQVSVMACAVDRPYSAVDCSRGDGTHFPTSVEDHDGDPYAATRRAIVRAAAAVVA